MKLYWSLKSIPEFKQVDEKSLRAAWSSCYSRERNWRATASVLGLFIFVALAGVAAEACATLTHMVANDWRYQVVKYGVWFIAFLVGIKVKDWIVLNSIIGNLQEYAKKNFSDPRD